MSQAGTLDGILHIWYNATSHGKFTKDGKRNVATRPGSAAKLPGI